MNSGSEFIGSWNGLTFRKVDAPDVISTGAVSPTPRAMPRISAVARPGRGGRQHDPPHGLPLRRAERQARLAQAAGHDAQRDLGRRGR